MNRGHLLRALPFVTSLAACASPERSSSQNAALSPVPWGFAAAEAREGVRSVAAGARHVCAVLEAGTVECFQIHPDGPAWDDARPLELPAKAVAITMPLTRDHFGATNVLLEDGRVVTRASDAYYSDHTPQAMVALAAPAAEIAGSCAKLVDGRVQCWRTAIVGSAQATRVWVAPPSAFERAVVDLSADGYRACVALDDGSFTCWSTSETPPAPTRPAFGRATRVHGSLAVECVGDDTRFDCHYVDRPTEQWTRELPAGTVAFTQRIENEPETTVVVTADGWVVGLPRAAALEDGFQIKVGGRPVAVAERDRGSHVVCVLLEGGSLRCLRRN